LHYKENKDGKKKFVEFYEKETVEQLVITTYNHQVVGNEETLERFQSGGSMSGPMSINEDVKEILSIKSEINEVHNLEDNDD
jgi:cytoplasmic iron level regulating protein YaaA (DUF328/UPF0246 family)